MNRIRALKQHANVIKIFFLNVIHKNKKYKNKK